MVVSPEIKKPEDLRGKKLTVSRFGSNSDYATRKILLKWGLKPDIDVAVLQIPGGQPTRLAAIQTKQVHGMVAQPPVTNLARKFNMNIIAEPEDFGGAYPTTPVAARISFIKDKRDTVRKFTRALLEGIHLYKTNKDFSKKVIGKYVKTDDNDALEDSYQFFSRLVPQQTLSVPRRDQRSPRRTRRKRSQGPRGETGRLRRHEYHQRVRRQRIYRRAV